MNAATMEAPADSRYWLHVWQSYAAGSKAGERPFAPATPSYIPAEFCDEAYRNGYADAHARAVQLRGIRIVAEVA